MSKNIQKLRLDNVVASVKTQARASLNEDAVADYKIVAESAKAKGAEDPFPPLVVFRDESGKDWLADGFHRRKALKSAGYEEYDFEVRSGTETDAFLYACTANREHGVRLTREDLKHNLDRVLTLPDVASKPNTEIAAMIGASEFYVRKNRPAEKTSEVRVVRNPKTGKKTQMQTGRIGKKVGKAPKPSSKPKAPNAAEKLENDYERAKTRLVTVLTSHNEALGKKFKKALEEGTLSLTQKDVIDYTKTSDGRIIKVAPLVIEHGMKPQKALDFIDREYNGSMRVSEAVLHCIVLGGKFEFKEDHFKVMVIDTRLYAAGLEKIVK